MIRLGERLLYWLNVIRSYCWLEAPQGMFTFSIINQNHIFSLNLNHSVFCVSKLTTHRSQDVRPGIQCWCPTLNFGCSEEQPCGSFFCIRLSVSFQAWYRYSACQHIRTSVSGISSHLCHSILMGLNCITIINPSRLNRPHEKSNTVN